MLDFIYQTTAVTLVMIASLAVMALGTYVIFIICFRLPFLFWVRPKFTVAPPQGEFPHPQDVELSTLLSDRAKVAA
jgi:hypothetical protein